MGNIDKNDLKLSDQRESIHGLMNRLAEISDHNEVEKLLKEMYGNAPEDTAPDSDNYYDVLNFHLYRNIIKRYKHGLEGVCLWRFFKVLSEDQLGDTYEEGTSLEMMDHLVRTYFYSGPLDDLTCIFIPINDSSKIQQYLNWIKSYFYDVNYPTSLLWLYALDSSVEDFIPHEIVYVGKRIESSDESIMIPDFSHTDTVLLKRFSSDERHYLALYGDDANYEFQQIFTNLQMEYRDRCLSHSGKKIDTVDKQYGEEWEKFEEVLEFGVSDQFENGCISFSDLRNSTNFLNKYGKNTFRNDIQQPFFESTKLISKLYNGRIDKFMGDNVMCVFLNSSDGEQKNDIDTILNNFFSIFGLCKVLLTLLSDRGLIDTELGLRSGVSYGQEILRSNLGNEIVRDFTVTGETVNFAARLEHFSFHELILHNQNYFHDAIQRFPEISELASVIKSLKNFNPETKSIIQNYTLYQNIVSNLEKLNAVRFDVRCNDGFYIKLKEHLQTKGYGVLNAETARLYGYEEFDIEGHHFRFYFSYFNPKGFEEYEKIWILPFSLNMLRNLDIEKLR